MKNLGEIIAGVMAALIRVYDGFSPERASVIPDQVIDSLQHEFHLQRVADHIGQNLLGKGIQDGGKIGESPIIRKIRNIRQQYNPGAILFELALQQIFRYIAGFQGFGQLFVWICFPDGANQMEFFHQPSDFLDIHDDRRILMD